MTDKKIFHLILRNRLFYFARILQKTNWPNFLTESPSDLNVVQMLRHNSWLAQKVFAGIFLRRKFLWESFCAESFCRNRRKQRGKTSTQNSDPQY
jgi:hypothetical protein